MYPVSRTCKFDIMTFSVNLSASLVHYMCILLNLLFPFLCLSLHQKERQSYEVIVKNGKLVYRESGIFVDTVEGSKWIFVLSASWILYIGQKKKGTFRHSSFLAGEAITAAGRLVAHGGVLEVFFLYRFLVMTNI